MVQCGRCFLDWQCDARRKIQFPDFELIFSNFRFRIFFVFVSRFLCEPSAAPTPLAQVPRDCCGSERCSPRLEELGSADLGVVDWGVENVSRQEHVEPI